MQLPLPPFERRTSFSSVEFLATCQSQGVVLDARIFTEPIHQGFQIYTGQNEQQRDENDIASITLTSLIMNAFSIFRHEGRRVQLANEIIQNRQSITDGLFQMLQMVINYSVQPISPDDVRFTHFFSENEIAQGNLCMASDEEGEFAESFQNILSGKILSNAVKYGGVIYVDESGRPIILQKARDCSTAIATTDTVCMDGIPVPKGALLRIEGDRVKNGHDALDRDHFAIRPVSDIQAIAIGRPTVYSYLNPSDRPITDYMIFSAQGYANLLWEIKPNDISEIATQAVIQVRLAA